MEESNPVVVSFTVPSSAKAIVRGSVDGAAIATLDVPESTLILQDEAMFGLKDNEQIYLRGYSDGFNNNHLNATPRFIGPAFNLTSDSEAATVVKEFEISDTFESTDSYNVGFNDSTFVDDIKTRLNIIYNSIDGKQVNIDLSKNLIPERTGLFDDGFMIISFKHNGKTYEFDYRNEMGYPVATGTVSDDKIAVIKTPSDWQLYSIDKEEIISTYHGKPITASGSNVIYIYPEWKNKVYTFTSVDSESYSINFDGITADKEHRTININCELDEWSGFGYQWQPYDGSRDFNVTVNLIGIDEDYLSKKNLLETINNMKTYPGIKVNFLPSEVIPPEAELASENWRFTTDDATNTITLEEYIGVSDQNIDFTIKNKYLDDNGKLYENVKLANSDYSSGPFYNKKYAFKNLDIEEGVKTGDNITYLFGGLQTLENIDLSKLDMSEATNATALLQNTYSLKSAKMNKTGNNINTLGAAFQSSSIESFDLSSIDNSKIGGYQFTFKGCYNLKEITMPEVLGGGNSLISTGNMFEGCTSLENRVVINGLPETYYQLNSVFKGCSKLKEVVLNFSGDWYYDVKDTFSGCTSLETVYVLDESAKTKIEGSSNFPANATVVVGIPT